MARSFRLPLAVAPFLFVSIASAQYPGATPISDDLKPGFNAITIPKAKGILKFLSGPECEGRGTGQPGFQKAADFVARKFHDAGLVPMGDHGTYFQNQIFSRTTAFNVSLVDDKGRMFPNKSLILNAPRAKVDFTAPVVIVRADDTTSKLSEDDAKKLDGKIVIEVVPQGRSALRSQVGAADTKATFMVRDGDLGSSSAIRQGTASSGSSTVSGRMSRRAVEQLDSNCGAFLRGATKAPALLDTGKTFHLKAESKTEQVMVPNVVGLLPGSDPELKNEYIGIGGHLDHLGIVNGVIYPGADDDGSGSTAVMLIADAMAHNPVKPKRGILFMTFCGEEMGLLGSSYLSDHPPVPLDKMVSELQMDMVARDSYGAQNGDPNRMDKLEENIQTIRLVGSKRISTDLDKTILDENAHIGFKFRYDAEDVYTRSDHYNFAKHGVPIAFLFDGFTPDYHQPSDTFDKIDFEKLTNSAKLYYLTAYAIANNPQAPRHDVKQEG